MIYLDYAATAPIDPAARVAMADALVAWANPSSVHGPGRRARGALEAARGGIATALGWAGTVLFTSGATEALGVALGRSRAASHIVSAIEHAAVAGQAPAAACLPVDPHGVVRIDVLEAMLADAAPPAIVSVMHANNETGVIQPLNEVAALVRARRGILLADCVQTAGKLPLPDADLVVLSAHKIGGPPGIGALLVRDLSLLDPAAPAGGQEQGYRPGTENLPAACGFAAAIEARIGEPGWTDRARRMRDRIESAAVRCGAEVIGAKADRLPNISCLRLPGAEAMLQLIRLDLAGFAVSAGAACASGKVRGSHVLRAMGYDDVAAGEAIRVSVGWETTEHECDAFIGAYRDMAEGMLRRAA